MDTAGALPPEAEKQEAPPAGQDTAGTLAWEASTSCSVQRTKLLRTVLEQDLQYHRGSGLLQLAFTTPQERGELIEALNGAGLWRYSGGGNNLGVGARSWSYTPRNQPDLEILRRLARTSPPLARLLQLHDCLRRISNELQGPGEQPVADARKGPAGREDDALQNFFIRLCLPTLRTLKPMSLAYHRDIYGGAHARPTHLPCPSLSIYLSTTHPPTLPLSICLSIHLSIYLSIYPAPTTPPPLSIYPQGGSAIEL